jgi:hypothetical protein
MPAKKGSAPWNKGTSQGWLNAKGYRNGETQPRLSGAFGVAQTTISQIVTGKSWRHVA